MKRFSKLLQKAMACAGDAVVVTGEPGVCLHVSAALAERYGYDKAALEAAGGLLALVADEKARGRVRQVLEAGGTFEEEVAVKPRDGAARPVHLRVEALSDEAGAPIGAVSVFTEPAAPPPRSEAVEHRLRVEAALVEATHLLVSHGEMDFEKVLGTVGEAIGAECVYLFTLPPDDELRQAYEGEEAAIYAAQDAPYAVVQDLSVGVSVWHRDGTAGRDAWRRRHEADRGGSLPPGQPADEVRLRLRNALQQGEAPVRAIPVLSSTDRLYGYLGFEYGAGAYDAYEVMEEDARMLNVLGDMLSAYFERSIAEQALRESEERWRLLVDSHPDPILISADGQILYINRSGAALLGSDDPPELVGRSPFDFISAEHHAVWEADLAALARGVAVGPHERDIIRLDGDERIVEWFSVPIVYRGRRAAQSVLRDVTQRKQAERALQESEERYRTFIGTISEAIWRVELERPVPVHVAVPGQVRQIYGQGILAECNQGMARLLDAGSARELTGHSLEALMPCLHERLIEEFIQSGYRLHNREYTSQWEDAPPRHLVINAVGTLEEDHLVRIWGSCVDVTERVELERQMVTDLERQQQQIGRDLHDGVGQFLTSMRMLSNNLAERFFGESDEGFALARKVAGFAEEASRRVREIYTGLAPVQLYEDGLSPALEELAANINTLPGITCTYLYDGRTDVGAHQARLHLYRIAQEATNNALKHAHPKHILISFGQEDGQIVLQVEDDGISFDVNKRAGKSLGLRSMYYRARAIGAVFTIHSQPDAGTTVRCILPVTEDARYLAESTLSKQEGPYL